LRKAAAYYFRAFLVYPYMDLEKRILREDDLSFDIELVFLDLKMNLLIDEYAACKDRARQMAIECELKELQSRIARGVDFMRAGNRG
jgi:hypothetical protein